MKKILKSSSIVAILSLGIAVIVGGSAPVWANSLVQADKDVSTLATGKTVDGAAFMVGETVEVKGVVKGDLYCAGNNLTVSGEVEGDVICAGNNLTVSGKVGGDVRIAGNNLSVRGTVEGSLTMAGNNLVVELSAKVGRDLLATGSVVNVSGAVARDARVMANSVNITGVLGRNLDANVNRLVVADGARVGGYVYYTSDHEAKVASGSVAGLIQRTAPSSQDNLFGSKQTTLNQQALGALIAVGMLVATSLFLVLVAPRFVRSISLYGDSKRLLMAGLVGFGVLLLTPMAVVVLAISTVGFGVSVVLLLAYILGLLLAGSVTSYVIGRLVMPSSKNIFLTVLIGALLLGIVGVIPVVGFFVLFVALCIGLGLMVLGLRSQYVGQAYSEETVETKTVNKARLQENKKR